MHELYLWPFQDAVKAGVASFMCSYNRINGSYGCANSKTQNGLLKTELGFQGYVMSDWSATHAGNATIQVRQTKMHFLYIPADFWQAGLDMDMPGGISFSSGEPSYFGQNLTMLVNNGSLPVERVDDMCRRIMTPYFYLQQGTDYPPTDGSEPDLNSSPRKSQSSSI